MIPASPRTDAVGEPMPPLDTIDEIWRLCSTIERAHGGPNGASNSWIRILHPQGEERLRRWMGRGYPIVHFSCHGERESLILENDVGVGERVSGKALAEWMRLGKVELVVISACASEEIGRLLYEQGAATCVIATKAPIRDEDARRFCSALYGELAQSRSVAAALEYSKRKLSNPEVLVTFPEDPKQLGALSWTLGQGPAEHSLNQSFGRTLFPFQLAKGFVGRHAELRSVDLWLESPKHVMAISGLRQTGKTSFAVYATLRLCQDFKARVFISATGISDFGPTHVLAHLQRELQQTPSDSLQPQDEIARLLNERSLFLILDSVELIKPEQAQILANALQGLRPQSLSKVLLTTHALALKHPLVELVVDKRDILHIDSLRPAEAVSLLFDAGSRATSVGLKLPSGFDLRDKGTWKDLRREAQLPSFWTAPMIGVLDELAGLAFHHPPLLKLAGEVAAKGEIDDEGQGYKEAYSRLRGTTQYRSSQDELEKCRKEIIAEKVSLLTAEMPDAVLALFAALPFSNGAREVHLLYVALGRNSFRKEQCDLFRSAALKLAVKSKLLRLQDERYELPVSVRDYLSIQTHPYEKKLSLRHAEAVRELASDELGWHDISPALEWLTRAVLEQPAAIDKSDEDRLLVEYAHACLRGPLRGRLGLDHLKAMGRAAERAGTQKDVAFAVEAEGSLYLELARRQYEEAEILYSGVGAQSEAANVRSLLENLQRAHALREQDVAKPDAT